MLAHYLIPLAPFILIGINSALCLFVFLCAKHEMRAMNLRWRRRQTAQESATEELKAQVAQLSARILDAEERTGVLVPPTPPRSGMNLNKRSQVIRMSRRGEQVEKIAASLNLPQREVELLLKVHGSVVYSSNDVNSNAVNS
jgi:DNA-binding NarL/FixJ family response regulator